MYIHVANKLLLYHSPLVLFLARLCSLSITHPRPPHTVSQSLRFLVHPRLIWPASKWHGQTGHNAMNEIETNRYYFHCRATHKPTSSTRTTFPWPSSAHDREPQFIRSNLLVPENVLNSKWSKCGEMLSFLSFSSSVHVYVTDLVILLQLGLIVWNNRV